MIRFKNLKKSNNISKRLERLYREAFPRNERPPYFYIKHKAMKQGADFFGIYDNNRFIGLLYTVIYKEIVYIFFFAIKEDFRGLGYGSQVLGKVKHKYRDSRIVLCIEELDKNSDNYSERLRRKEFYEKNGFTDTGVKVCEFGVNYEMLSCFGNVSYDEYRQLMRNYLGEIGFNLFYRVKQLS